MGSLKQNFLFQLITSFFYVVAPLITFPYVSRVLGPEKIGAVNFIDYTSQIFILIASFGIPLYGAREVAKNNLNKDKLREVVSEIFSIHLLATFVCLISFFIIVFSFEDFSANKELVFLATLNIVINAFSFDWFIHGLENFKFLSFRALLTRFLSVIAIFLFVKNESDYIRYYFILIGSSVLIVVIDIIQVYKREITFRFTFSFLKHIKPLLLFFLTTASVSVYTFFDTFLLGVITGSLAVGYYTTSMKIIRISQNFINGLGGVIMPRISFLVETKNSKEIEHILYKSLYYVYTVTIPLSFFFYLLAPEIVDLLAGSKFRPSVTTLQILSILPLIIGLSNIFGLQILIPYKKEKEMLLSVLAGSILSFLFCIILCPTLEQNGAAIACLLSEIAVTVLLGYYARQLTSFAFPLRRLLNIIFSSILFIPAILIIKSLFESNFLVFSFSVLACSLVYILLQYFLFTNSVIREAFKLTLDIIRKPLPKAII